MATVSRQLAAFGAPPGHMERMNAFEWAFSNPYEHESEYVPLEQRVPHIEDSRPIFVDHQSGMAPCKHL